MSKINIKNFIIPLVVFLGLALGTVFHFLGHGGLETVDKKIWLATLLIGSVPPAFRMLKDLWRRHFGVDIIAITAIAASLLFGQYLAGTVIVLMLSGGEALEAYALQRARKELTALLSHMPSLAHLKAADGLKDIPISELKAGDVFVVKPGEVVPADGLILAGRSDVNESAITGESVPVEKRAGRQLYSGSVNQDGALEIRALRASGESTYEKIIKLVRQASESRAPVMRLADRYSIWFTAITFILAFLAWQLSHDPIRLLAVLVVATPCPLILATPIAIMSGVSRAASRGIIVKSGGALEKLAEVKAFIFDKTGTLTLGTPEVSDIVAFTSAILTPHLMRGRDPLKISADNKQNVLNIAASLDQLSGHILAKSLRIYAVEKDIKLEYPTDFQETFGDGVSGNILGQKYLFGKLTFLQKLGVRFSAENLKEHEQFQKQGKIAVYLAGNGQLLGAILFADIARPEIKSLFREMKTLGLDKIVMLTGDKKDVADIVAGQLGLSDIHAECLPEEKVAEVKDHKKQFGSVCMVGDGVNDAPALAAADVGIAIGGHGNTASSESGDIVITSGDLSRVGQALKISKMTLRIAKQSIFVGIGVSVLLMIIAALGHIQPVYGALIQEALDVVVILNALRVNFVKI